MSIDPVVLEEMITVPPPTMFEAFAKAKPEIQQQVLTGLQDALVSFEGTARAMAGGLELPKTQSTHTAEILSPEEEKILSEAETQIDAAASQLREMANNTKEMLSREIHQLQECLATSSGDAPPPTTDASASDTPAAASADASTD